MVPCNLVQPFRKPPPIPIPFECPYRSVSGEHRLVFLNEHPRRVLVVVSHYLLFGWVDLKMLEFLDVDRYRQKNFSICSCRLAQVMVQLKKMCSSGTQMLGVRIVESWVSELIGMRIMRHSLKNSIQSLVPKNAADQKRSKMSRALEPTTEFGCMICGKSNPEQATTHFRNEVDKFAFVLYMGPFILGQMSFWQTGKCFPLKTISICENHVCDIQKSIRSFIFTKLKTYEAVDKFKQWSRKLKMGLYLVDSLLLLNYFINRDKIQHTPLNLMACKFCRKTDSGVFYDEMFRTYTHESCMHEIAAEFLEKSQCSTPKNIEGKRDDEIYPAVEILYKQLPCILPMKMFRGQRNFIYASTEVRTWIQLLMAFYWYPLDGPQIPHDYNWERVPKESWHKDILTMADPERAFETAFVCHGHPWNPNEYLLHVFKGNELEKQRKPMKTEKVSNEQLEEESEMTEQKMEHQEQLSSTLPSWPFSSPLSRPSAPLSASSNMSDFSDEPNNHQDGGPGSTSKLPKIEVNQNGEDCNLIQHKSPSSPNQPSTTDPEKGTKQQVEAMETENVSKEQSTKLLEETAQDTRVSDREKNGEDCSLIQQSSPLNSDQLLTADTDHEGTEQPVEAMETENVSNEQSTKVSDMVEQKMDHQEQLPITLPFRPSSSPLSRPSAPLTPSSDISIASDEPDDRQDDGSISTSELSKIPLSSSPGCAQSPRQLKETAQDTVVSDREKNGEDWSLVQNISPLKSDQLLTADTDHEGREQQLKAMETENVSNKLSATVSETVEQKMDHQEQLSSTISSRSSSSPLSRPSAPLSPFLDMPIASDKPKDGGTRTTSDLTEIPLSLNPSHAQSPRQLEETAHDTRVSERGENVEDCNVIQQNSPLNSHQTSTADRDHAEQQIESMETENVSNKLLKKASEMGEPKMDHQEQLPSTLPSQPFSSPLSRPSALLSPSSDMFIASAEPDDQQDGGTTLTSELSKSPLSLNPSHAQSPKQLGGTVQDTVVSDREKNGEDCSLIQQSSPLNSYQPSTADLDLAQDHGGTRPTSELSRTPLSLNLEEKESQGEPVETEKITHEQSTNCPDTKGQVVGYRKRSPSSSRLSRSSSYASSRASRKSYSSHKNDDRSKSRSGWTSESSSQGSETEERKVDHRRRSSSTPLSRRSFLPRSPDSDSHGRSNKSARYSRNGDNSNFGQQNSSSSYNQPSTSDPNPMVSTWTMPCFSDIPLPIGPMPTMTPLPEYPQPTMDSEREATPTEMSDREQSMVHREPAPSSPPRPSSYVWYRPLTKYEEVIPVCQTFTDFLTNPNTSNYLVNSIAETHSRVGRLPSWWERSHESDVPSRITQKRCNKPLEGDSIKKVKLDPKIDDKSDLTERNASTRRKRVPAENYIQNSQDRSFSQQNSSAGCSQPSTSMPIQAVSSRTTQKRYAKPLEGDSAKKVRLDHNIDDKSDLTERNASTSSSLPTTSVPNQPDSAVTPRIPTAEPTQSGPVIRRRELPFIFR